MSEGIDRGGRKRNWRLEKNGKKAKKVGRGRWGSKGGGWRVRRRREAVRVEEGGGVVG